MLTFAMRGVGRGCRLFRLRLAIQGFAGGPATPSPRARKQWNWIAAQPLFLRGRARRSPALPDPLATTVSVALVLPLILSRPDWTAGALGAASASTALLAGLVLSPLRHWVWGGGWLAQIGFVDAAAAGPVLQAVGGLTALAIAWISGGPRRGKYSKSEGGMPAAIPPGTPPCWFCSPVF